MRIFEIPWKSKVIFNKFIEENFLNLGKVMLTQLQETKTTLNKKRNSSYHTHNIQNEEKNLKIYRMERLGQL